MLDLARYEAIKPQPHAIFDRLAERRTRVRYMVPEGDDYRAVTWGAYARSIRHIGAWLAGVGFEPGARGAIFAHNSVEWMVAAMAIQSVGGVMVPVYPASTSKQAAYVAEHAEAKVLFVGDTELLGRVLAAWSDYRSVEKVVFLSEKVDLGEAMKRLKDQGKDVPALADVQSRTIPFAQARELGRAQDDDDPKLFDMRLAALGLDSPALMLYTSGTTGNPKGVPLTHSNVGHNGLDWLRCFAPLLRDDRGGQGCVDVLWLPMSHIFGFGEACVGDTLGYTTYLADPATALSKLPEVRPDVFFSVPAYWEKIANAALSEPDAARQRARLTEVTGGRLAFCLSGGAGLKQEVKEFFYRNGLLIMEGYGLSECSPTLTLNRPADFRFDTVGKALPSVQLKLAEDGEILAKGPNIFAGYHREPDATRDAFTDDGWFKTGDVGRFTEDGFLQIVDRKKEILVTAGGKNVPPANIELRFADEPLVRHVIVYGDGKKFLVAGVWLDPEAVAQRLGKEGIDNAGRSNAVEGWVSAAIERINDELAKYEQIKRFKIMDVPLTVAGGHLTSTLKVRRKHVWQSFQREFEALYE